MHACQHGELYIYVFISSLLCMYIQWNLLKKDTTETKESVLIREVSSSGGKMYGLWLTWDLERCSLFRGVLYEGFYCIYLFSHHAFFTSYSLYLFSLVRFFVRSHFFTVRIIMSS